jgi:hypothetical protein
MKPELESPPRDRRVQMGLIVTVLWLAAGIAYVALTIGWDNFFDQPPGAMGEFLDGAFAPLAFLWLVLGLFLQQSELSANNRAIQRQHEIMLRAAEQAEIQTQAIAANELHARQDTFIGVAQMVALQLEVTAGMLFMSSQGPPGAGLVSADEMDALWARLATGESSIFSRRMILLYVSTEDPGAAWELLYGTPIRSRHCESYVQSFERLLGHARECDLDGMIVDALKGSGQGRLYDVMVQARQNPPVA